MAEKRDSRWLCCGRTRRSSFCPDCGASRPENTLTDAELLADEFEAASETAKRTAATFRNKAEKFAELEPGQHCPTRPDEHWTNSDEVHVATRQAEAQEARNVKFARYAVTIRRALALSDDGRAVELLSRCLSFIRGGPCHELIVDVAGFLGVSHEDGNNGR